MSDNELTVEEITSRIPVGQTNLDRMKADIHSTVRTLFGLVPHEDLVAREGQELKFLSRDCWWHVRVVYAHRRSIQITCTESSRRNGNIAGIRAFDNIGSVNGSGQNHELGLELIEVVYNDLKTFVGGMLEKFPKLREQLDPHMKAAVKQL